MASETYAQIEDHALEIIEQKKRPDGDSNTKVQVASDATLVTLSAGFAAFFAGMACEQYREGTCIVIGHSMPVFVSVFSNVFSGMMWVFSIGQLIRYHVGDNHQTWNESAKDDLQTIINEFHKRIKNEMFPLEDEAYKVYSELLNEAQAALDDDDIYLAKKNQNYNFIRFVITGAAFATTLGLYISPFAAIAVSIVVLMACVRYGYEMHKIQDNDTHLDRAFKKVKKAFSEADGREEYLGLIPSASIQEEQEEQEEQEDQEGDNFVLVETTSDSDTNDSDLKDLEPDPQISNEEPLNVKDLWSKAQGSLECRASFPFWSPKAPASSQHQEPEEEPLLQEGTSGHCKTN